MKRGWPALVRAGAVAAALGTVHSVVNVGLVRRPPRPAPPLGERVSVLLPVRDEAHRLEPALRALLAALGDRVELVVLDDGSTDGTPELVRRVVGDDDRVVLRTGAPLPAGWLGKPHACQQLADAADPASTVLVFVDADVVVEPDAVAAAVALLRSTGLDLVSPYPRQEADGLLPRLVQPLVTWSWLTLLPVRLAERTARPSLGAANGQFLVVDRAAYVRSGGHGSVRDQVLEDLALLRAVKRTGGRGVAVDGSRIARCRMYDDAGELVRGYRKSLWAAFGSATGGAAVVGALSAVYVAPAVAALRGSRPGALGYLAAVAGRVVTARAAGARAWPDALAHPVSVAAFGALTASSWWGRRRGTLAWKGRPVP